MIAIGADHGGFTLKENIIATLKGEIEFKDFGTDSEESVNYPEFAFKVAESVASGECEAGVLICKSGIGMDICANKVKGIRCATITSIKSARHAKEDNNANIIAFGAEDTTLEAAEEYIYMWLSSEFQGGRHAKRVQMIKDYEEKHFCS